MYLERAKVTNFRGIRRLSVDFESDSTFLIGENQWGKTSLLKVLWMLLGQGEELCQFDKSDLYVPITGVWQPFAFLGLEYILPESCQSRPSPYDKAAYCQCPLLPGAS